MSDESTPQSATALLVSDGHGHYYAIPATDLERYRLSPEAAADVVRDALPDTSGFFLRSTWERPPQPPLTPPDSSLLGLSESPASGFAVAVPMTALRRFR